ncbi:MAG: FABP family protein [Ignavibacteriaceae bacterium]
MNITQANFDNIRNLLGRWNGYGVAQYPTIKKEDYFEELIFSHNEESSFLHYEQKTWIKNEKGKFEQPIFWETGFLITLEVENSFELCNAQKSGRIEVLSGKLSHTNGINFIDFKSKNFANDEKLIDTSRKFRFTDKELNYELWMSIKNNKNFDIHLKANLRKVL